MVLLRNGLDDDQIENESEPAVGTDKNIDEPVLQARDTNTTNPARPKAGKQIKNKRE